MKHYLLFAFFTLSALGGVAQQNLNLGGAVIYDSYRSPGFALKMEYEKFFTPDFSLPLKLETGYVYGGEKNSLSIELHKGFRKYFASGIFLEQYIGVGAMANFYHTDDIWYFDKYQWGYRYAPGANWGFKPSTGVVVGYDLTHASEQSHLICLKTDVYWNLGFRPLHLPYSSVQLAYVFTFKNL
ncbi:hypothetical protein [Lishizhenia sp.]|uniref:hypothetical protein n=1 Tax=Lishizhenia sp. TaxID=2497594 RepID=UPI00299EAD1E|nr:hypothetical protein [Lishizhenia sp.]MDX1446576.1 hypothetical protein [Lishizhenia sp.]